MSKQRFNAKRRSVIKATASLLVTPSLRAQATQQKVLRYAFPAAETGFDPAQVSDIYSRTVTAHIFESPLAYDHLARPYKLKLSVAAEMPQLSADFRSCIVRLKQGVYFADDPVFKGKPRELVAQDFVYALKRFYDPRWKSPLQASVEEETLIGLRELREAALKTKKPFDYDTEVDGLRALDRYTVQYRLREPNPRFLYSLLANPDIFGAVAREVVEFYGDTVMEHPVGTGPYKLSSWKRSSKIVLERNPKYREVVYDAEPNTDDLEGQALARRLKGQKLPMIDRVEISIIDENQPRWLSFLNEQQDILPSVPLEFANIAVPRGQLAPHLAKRGVQKYRTVASDFTLTCFNIDNPVVGGYTPEKIALRRAISLAIDLDREINQIRRGQAIAAQSPIAPGTFGYDPKFRSENSEYNPARARALLDLFGYVDRDGDGWREQPDGSPLTLEVLSTPDQISRQFDESWKKNMDAVGLRLAFRVGQWPEHLKRARSGDFMMWSLGSSAASPDGLDSMVRMYGPATGGQNLTRFKLKAFDELYDRARRIPDGPERLGLLRELERLAIAYAPAKFHVHRIATDLAHPWVIGYRRMPYWRTFWHYLDIDMSGRTA